jgi:PAS domain S-box-containing protein
LALALTATWAWWKSSKAVAEQQLKTDFEFRVRDAEARITQRMAAHEQILRGAAGLFDASAVVDRDEFRKYVAALSLADTYPGIQGVGFSVIVPAAGLAEHVAAVRREGFATYAINPEGDRPLYTSIIYLEPFADRNLRAFGYDMFAEPVCREAMERSRDTGAAALSGKVRLVQESERDVQAGTLLYLPVYRSRALPGTLTERRADLAGWVYLPLRMDDLMRKLLGERAAELAISLYDGSAPSAEGSLHDSDRQPDGPEAAPSGLYETRALDIAGHRWTLVVRALPGFEARHVNGKAQALLFAGVAMSLVVALFTWWAAGSRARALSAGRKMNRELLASQTALQASRESLVQVIEGSSDATWDWNLKTGGLTKSRRFDEMLGYGFTQEVIGRAEWEATLHPDDAGRVAAALEAHLAGSAAQYDVEFRMRTGAGGWKWVRSRGKVVEKDAAGAPTRMAGTATDIDLEKAGRDRQLQDARLQSLERSVNDIELLAGLDGRIIEANDRAEKAYGYSRAELRGMDARDLRASSEADDLTSQITRIIAQHGMVYETRHRRRDGSEFPVEVSARSFTADGKGYLHVLVRDLTDRRKVEAALRETEARFRATANSAPVLMWMAGLDKGCTWFNETWLAFTGKSLEDEAGDGWAKGVHPDDSEACVKDYSRAFDARVPFVLEYRLRRFDGEHRWLLDHGKPRLDERGEFVGYIGSCIDITDRKRSEQALVESKQRLSLVIDASNDGFWTWSAQGDRLTCSARGAEILDLPPGEAELSRDEWALRVHPDDRKQFEAAVAAHLAGESERISAEYRVRLHDGAWRWAGVRGKVVERDAGGRPTAMAGTLSDIHGTRQLQQKVYESTRLASVGTLAAGVAHEINNPLAWVSANLGYLLDQLPEVPDPAAPPLERAELRELLAEAAEGTTRIARIVAAMRSLGRPEAAGQVESVDVGQELENAVLMVRSQLVSRAALVVDVAAGLPPARVKTNELGRVFLNLLVNAAQAIPEGKPAMHRVAARARLVGSELVIEISDTGSGMSAQVREHIFDPFFTTKPVGVGSGLGLPIAQTIVQSAGGRIEVETEEGRGSTFRVVLPAYQKQAEVEAAAGEVTAPVARRRVLVIDDEVGVAKSIERWLRLHHDVTLATSAVEALRRIDQGQTWDAVLCDVVMSGLDGVDFYDALVARRHPLQHRLAFMTGGAFAERTRKFLAEHSAPTLPKPLELEPLLQTLRQLAGTG